MRSSTQTLDLYALPAIQLSILPQAWPRHVASAEATRQLLRLVRCTAGARMPGLLASPDCEIAMAASKTGSYHVAQVLLAGEFIRVYPRLRALKPLRTLLWL
jgi:hypothetical protein